MWQCVPVKKIVARLMIFALWLMLAFAVSLGSSWQSPVYAQSNIGYNQIDSVKESWNKRSVTLLAEKSATIPRPIIRFLPGENGDTVLVADFPGLLYQLPTKAIEVNRSISSSGFSTTSNTTKTGIKLVRIGKFQDSPPVCRIAVISSDPNKLRSVSFDTSPGKLTVRWSNALTANHTTPVVAPGFRSSGGPDIKQIAQAPPIAPPLGALDPATQINSSSTNSSLRPPIAYKAPEAKQLQDTQKKPKGIFSRIFKKAKSTYKDLTEQTAVNSQEEQATIAPPKKVVPPASASKSTTAIQSTPISIKGNPPQLAFKQTGADSYSIEVKSESGEKLNYKSFRLHNPERYVIDFPDLESLKDASIPNLAANGYLKGLRVGSPVIDNRIVGRMVLDLESTDTQVLDSGSQTAVSFMLGRQNNSLAGLKAPANSTVVLDAGHGGSDPGAQRGEMNEKDITLQIAKKTQALLTQNGVKVIMTRDSDSTVSLADRVAVTNKLRPDAFLSVHINSLETTSDIHGIETYYQTPQSLQLAKNIHKSLVDNLKAPDRNVRKARFYVVNRTTVPAVLAEVGFISHKDEKKKLASSAYQNEIAGALTRGMITYLRENNMVATNSQPKNTDQEVKSEKRDVQANSQSNLANPSIKSGTIETKQGNISPMSRLAQKGLGI